MNVKGDDTGVSQVLDPVEPVMLTGNIQVIK